jgi:hypothetical protein
MMTLILWLLVGVFSITVLAYHDNGSTGIDTSFENNKGVWILGTLFGLATFVIVSVILISDEYDS